MHLVVEIRKNFQIRMKFHVRYLLLTSNYYFIVFTRNIRNDMALNARTFQIIKY